MRLLFYVEPHPVRNGFLSHISAALLLAPVLSSLSGRQGFSFTLFGNDPVLDRLAARFPEIVPHLARPTAAESRRIAAALAPWNAAGIEVWLDVVQGSGEFADFYGSVLERLHAAHDFDMILVWSENGAVRQFGARHGLPVVHAELGPTRTPFPETLYFDTQGTNGRAAMRRTARRLIRDMAGREVPPAASWVAGSGRDTGEPADPGLVFRPQTAALLPQRPYVYVPLQLADDLNTLLHSPFACPEDFLRRILPELAEAGYAVMIKGHPASPLRPYNLRLEGQALNYAATAPGDVILLPRELSFADTAFVAANAAYTASINSSASFEAMLLSGTPLLYGAACFDADGWLGENLPFFPAQAVVDRTTRRDILDRVAAAHLGRLFVPKRVVQETDYLLRLLEEIRTGSDCGTVAGLDFTDLYRVGSLERGLPGLARIASSPLDAVSPGDAAVCRDGRLRIGRPGMPGPAGDYAAAGLCLGHVDRCEADGNGVLLSGWALEREGLRPPKRIMVLARGVCLAAARPNRYRGDVLQAVPGAEAPFCGFSFHLPEVRPEELSLAVACWDNRVQCLKRLRPGLALHDRGAASRPGIMRRLLAAAGLPARPAQ